MDSNTLTDPFASPPLPDISRSLDEIASQGLRLSQGDAAARTKLLATARSLCLSLETPVETLLRIVWAEPALNVACRVANEMGLFEKLSRNEASPKSSAQLSDMAGADPILMGRVLKHLAAMGVLNEVDADSYTPTIFAKSLVMPKYGDGISFCFDCIGPPFIRLPEYLAKTDYRNPQSAVDGPFQYGHKSDLHFFDWLKANPKVLETFNNHMIGYRSGRQKWDDFYPVNDFLGKGMKADKDAVLLVDVGGGLGHDIDEFHHKHSNLPGRLILQDQPIVINDVKNISESIELMTHDFFTEQPVKGARAYYMHSILHDWPDDKARVILENLKPAMVKGYSKVLIDENVINSKGAHWMSTGLDWFMMGFFSSSERLESAWEQLLESAGMKIVKIWTSEQGTESLIEAELA